jgi:copper chaperone CopZ
METVQLKTNLKCTGCIEKVTPVLNKLKGMIDWKVDLTNPEKILTVDADRIDVDEIKTALQKAGYTGNIL